MAEEFIIKSEAIETKINQLLPSQGGFQAGVDFSASTMVIPIVDLTETAEGSALRVDLQSALSHGTATVFDVNNAKTTLLSTTGYFRIVGTSNIGTFSAQANSIILNDGSTDKAVWKHKVDNITPRLENCLDFDLVLFNPAGGSIIVESDSASAKICGSIRQLADLSGNLVNP